MPKRHGEQLKEGVAAVSHNQREFYKQALEAIGMVAPSRTRILNKLNTVVAHSDDVQLRTLTEATREAYMRATHSPALAIQEMNGCKREACRLIEYCRKQLDTTLTEKMNEVLAR